MWGTAPRNFLKWRLFTMQVGNFLSRYQGVGVSKRVGHANPTMTMKVYAHVLDEIDQDPMKLVEEHHAAATE